MSQPRQAVCTICAKNYLHFARTLMDSVARVHPEWDRYVLLVDRVDGAFDPERENFRVLEVLDLDLPRPGAFCFRYSILELNTAVKPWLLHHLFREHGYDRVVYLDPDIRAYRPFDELQATFDEGGFCVLTPHLTAPLDDGKLPGEAQILISGSYNLGFLGLQQHPSLEPFLRWWEDRLERDCVVDVPNGLFVDQKWIDLVPGMFPGARVLRDEAYNVAYWNLPHRRVTRSPDGGWLVNGRPLAFFHFSGLDPRSPQRFSKHQNRFRLEDLGAAVSLVEQYCGEVIAHGIDTCSRWGWSFSRFADGTHLPDVLRRFVRNHPEIEEAAPDHDPYRLDPAYFNEPWSEDAVGDPVVTRLTRAVWESQRDLQIAFPEPEGNHRERYAEWFVDVRNLGYELDDLWVAPVRASLRRARYGDGDLSGESLKRRIRTWGKRLLPSRSKQWIRRLLAPGRPTDPVPLRLLRAPGALVPGAWKTRVRRFVNPPPPGAEFAPSRVPTLPAGRSHSGFQDGDAATATDGLAWMGSRALVRLPADPRGELRIRGDYSVEPFLRSGLPARTDVALLVDGLPLETLSLTEAGPFERTFALGVNGDAPQVIELRASQTFVPAAVGLGRDDRALSVQIRSIAVGDDVLVDFAAPRPPARDIAAGLNVVGYLHAEMGVGESARLCVEAAEAAGLSTSRIDFRTGCRSRDGDRRIGDPSSRNDHVVNLFHVNADQMPVARDTLGARFFAGHINIGYWAWELPEFPEEWRPSFDLVDEIWTPSHFCAAAIAEQSPVPVVRMPHCVNLPPVTGAARERLGLPTDRFLWLTMWDMRSYRARKNPEGALDAFRRAFPDGTRAGLVVKTMGTEDFPEEWAALEAELRATPGVVILDRTLDRGDVYELEASCDGFLSLHRSEGFGLALAECMGLGKPVVATGWSGNVDFMNEENSCPVRYSLVELEQDHGPYRKGQHWADPDPEHAAALLRRMVDEEPVRRRIGAAARESVRRDLSPAAVGQLYARRLQALARFARP